MSRKGNCMDNGAMENFFGRLKVEMFYGEKFSSIEDFIMKLHDYINLTFTPKDEPIEDRVDGYVKKILGNLKHKLNIDLR